ncbi:MAG: undecaprenyldiphospho-muramoylpentapeptide beta-N-acetylglucosaminyltransferase [Burkholderiales bacterium]|nr:undecaprenyldiphospho-muramoylpentapeptide beta-N-acetylglucosaminyltransferase [Burkholderiales bacterium]
MIYTILIMAGGTGGHIFPALAVADHLKQQGWRVVWLGTRKGMEARVVPDRGYQMQYIAFSGVRDKGLLPILMLPLALLRAFWQSARIIRTLRPDVVLGVGGYVTFPAGMMASLLNRPLAIHEQNSVAGLSNRVLALVADRVLVGFARAFEEGIANPIARLLKPNVKVEWTGNPVRAEITALANPHRRFIDRRGSLSLLVVGGSLGAQILNQVVPQALGLLDPTHRPRTTHQAGEKHLADLKAAYSNAGVAAEIKPFIDDMAAAYGSCDLIICRAGALTIAEICAAGVASILVPFPHAVDDHQTMNARFLAKAGAAVLVPQGELTAERLAGIIKALTRDQIQEMATKARALAKPEATSDVAHVCMELAHAA